MPLAVGWIGGPRHAYPMAKRSAYFFLSDCAIGNALASNSRGSRGSVYPSPANERAKAQSVSRNGSAPAKSHDGIVAGFLHKTEQTVRRFNPLLLASRSGNDRSRYLSQKLPDQLPSL